MTATLLSTPFPASIAMMESAAEEVVNAVSRALQVEQPVWLATVLSTWGSAPRAPGSMMMWSPTTGLVGSVSGGCIEEDLLRQFKENNFDSAFPCEISYGENEEDTRAFKLPCGGRLHLLIEGLHKTNSKTKWQELAKCLHLRIGCARSVERNTGNWELTKAQPFALKHSDRTVDIYIGPCHKILIVGANQIASYLSRFCMALNYAVSVCDPSDQLSSEFPLDKNNFYRCYPDGLVDQKFNDSAAAVVAVSHDPRLDDMALMEALPGKAFYVGAMGSKKTSAARRKRLIELGIIESDLEKLRAPIGLDIGSKTPAEIAISIAADLVRVSKQGV